MDTSCEPMDVDLSANSGNVSYKDDEEYLNQSLASPVLQKTESETEVWNIKKYHIIRDKTSRKQRNNTATFAVGFIIMVLSLVLYSIFSIKCCNSLDLDMLKLKLHNRLYGQPDVIDNLMKSLENNANNKILFLYGGTGVGKTFTISLVLENFWNSSNVYHYTMPSFANTFSTDTMLGINMCESSIVVVDDLKDDADVKTQVAQVIKKSENLNKRITVILIYNCDVITGGFVKNCDETFASKLKSKFDDIDAYKSFIEYKPLTIDILKMCIKDELKGRFVNDVNFNKISSNFDVILDGCKGVYKKINFLNIS